MNSEEKLAQWAALFVKGQDVPAPTGDHYLGVTPAARELLRAIDAGGVPAFITANLKQIAQDNEIEVTDAMTPNEIVEALRIKAAS
jgi:hypothetical protein